MNSVDFPNPYIAGSPITSSEMFVGREDIFEFVQRELVGKHQDHAIVLYGQRRTGKTSVLYQMPRRLNPEQYLCVFIDLHGFALDGINGFLWELANHIIRELRKSLKIKIPREPFDPFEYDARTYFEHEFLNKVWDRIDGRKLVLMIDEAIRFQEQVIAGKIDKEIFEYLRHLMQHQPQLNFIFSLGSGLEELDREYSLLFNVALYKRISFLSFDAAQELITQPVKKYYEVEPKIVDEIFRLTSGHPYFIQLICHSLFNLWKQERFSSVQKTNIEIILDEVTERGLSVLKYTWEESTSGQKAVISGMAKAMGGKNRPVNYNDISNAWEIHSVYIPRGIMAEATKDLMVREVIKGSIKFEFTVELLRIWIEQNKRLSWVKEELSTEIETWNIHDQDFAPRLKSVWAPTLIYTTYATISSYIGMFVGCILAVLMFLSTTYILRAFFDEQIQSDFSIIDLFGYFAGGIVLGFFFGVSQAIILQRSKGISDSEDILKISFGWAIAFGIGIAVLGILVSLFPFTYFENFW